MEPNNFKKDTILVIDDSLDILDIQRVILESEGYEVLTALSIDEALLLLSVHKPPALILLDFKLEGSTGSEFLNLLSEKKPEILETVPLVFYSGVDEIPESKALGLIPKLTGMNDFLNEIKSFIENGREMLSKPHYSARFN